MEQSWQEQCQADLCALACDSFAAPVPAWPDRDSQDAKLARRTKNQKFVGRETVDTHSPGNKSRIDDGAPGAAFRRVC